MPLIPQIKTNYLGNAPALAKDTNRRPTVDNSGVAAAVGKLGSIKNPELPKSLAAPSEALSGIGRAIAQAGDVLSAVAQKEQEARTFSQVAEADNVMQVKRSQFTDYMNEHPNNPELYREEWARRSGQLKTELDANEKLTPGAREKIALNYSRFSTMADASVGEVAAKQTFGIAKDHTLASMSQAVESQDRPTYENARDTGRALGVLPEHEAEYYDQKFTEVGKQKVKEAKADQLTDAQNNVITFASGVGEKAATDYIDSQKLDPTDKERLRSVARSTADARLGDAVDTLNNGIATGIFDSPSRIDAEAAKNPHLVQNPRIVAKAKEFIAQQDTEEKRRAIADDREKNGVRNAVELRQRVAEYDPSKDPKREQYFGLVQEISTRTNQSAQGELGGALYLKYGKEAPKLTPREEVTKNIHATLGVMFDPVAGSIPWRGKNAPKDGSKPTDDLNAKQRAIDAQSAIEMKFEDWAKANPKDAQDLDKAKAKLMELVPGPAQRSILDAIKNSKTQAAAGTVTSYGYANDSTPDSNSRAGIGAFVPDAEATKIKAGQPSAYKLKPGDLAVSPDIATQFKAAGVKPMSDVLVKLANGETRRVRWADVTAQDAQVKSGAIKGVSQPLRGRFDFYSPTGKHPLDGTRVISWQKV